MKVSDEVQKQITGIKAKSDKQIFDIITEFAKKSNIYKIDDIIEDMWETGRIKEVSHSIHFDNSFTTHYVCERLKKDLSPFKNGEMGIIYACNIEKKY
ncbi:MAG: hypothetical protein OEL54_05005 [Flavobacteriaceae bacterium]|nr:hypothetical protein [Flavobacteriaceae bacterium]